MFPKSSFIKKKLIKIAYVHFRNSAEKHIKQNVKIILNCRQYYPISPPYPQHSRSSEMIISNTLVCFLQDLFCNISVPLMSAYLPWYPFL